MRRPPRRKKKLYGIPKELPPPTPMTRSERLQLAGSAAVVLAIVGGITWYHIVKIGQYDIDANLDYLISTYHLDGSQAQRLRALEIEFHSRDKRFGFLMPGDGAGDDHHRAISRLMSPQEGIRFLETEADRVR